MDPSFAKTLVQLGTYGPLGIMVVVAFYLYYMERQKTSELTAKLLEFAKTSVEADHEHAKAMEALGHLYELGMKFTEASTTTTNALENVVKSMDRLEVKIDKVSDAQRR